MDYIFQIYVLFSILALFVDIKTGISLYLFYFILVPVDLPMLFTSTNTVFHLFLLISLMFHAGKKKKHVTYLTIFKPFLPIVLMYLVLFMFTPFQEYVPFGRELQVWQNQMRIYFILPIVMWYVANIDSTSVRYFNVSVLAASLVVLLYGLFLLQFEGFNPYVMYLANKADITLSDTTLELNNQFRYLRRVSSVFMHPMSYGLFLTLLLCYLFSIRNKLNNIVFVVFMALNMVCIFYSGIRTPLIAFFIATVTYLFFIRNFKVAALIIVLGIAGMLVISSIPELRGTIVSIYDKKSDVDGSSIDMRLNQLEGCFKEISDCALMGKGYEWSMYYIGKNGSHPTILSFESVVFRVLCNWGVLGLLLYIFSYFRLSVRTFKMLPNQDSKALSLAFIFAFLAYCVGTGDYQYTTLFMLFFSLFISNFNVATSDYKTISKK